MIDWLDSSLKALNLVNTMNQPNGFTRLGYSKEEQESMDVFMKIAEELGLDVKRDKAGNLFARWEGEGVQPAVVTGSHLDTVSAGGGYDGVAGVLCGLGAIKKLKESGFEPTSPIEVVCFRSEESARFGVSTLGSKAVSGLFDPTISNVKDTKGTTIRESMESQGVEWEEIYEAERTEQEIKSFVELHIEQGVQIRDNGAKFGVVRGVACPIRLKIKAIGMAGHTGTTPMGKRQDAFVAIAPLISYVSEEAERLSNQSPLPLVATVSTVQLQPNVMNVIPGEVELGIDIRSVDDELKEKMATRVKKKCAQLEKEFNVTIMIETLVNNSSIFLNEGLTSRLEKVGEELGYTSHLMDSGAGHDVMNMANKWPSALVFIPCHDGISHHPKEHASIDDLEMGVNILARFLREEAGE